MLWIILGIALFIVILGPQYWTQHILKKYSGERADFPGTGGEFAKHLIKQQALNVTLENTPQGDHYDPTTKTVRLNDNNLDAKSLTSVVTAAHEVGHAIQHQQGMALLLIRGPLAKFAFYMEKTAQLALISTPIFLSFVPGAGRISIMIAIAGMLASTLVHSVTLPVEFNASFGKALPILKQGGYLKESDYKAARKILLACALTYVSAALSSLVNVWRWFRMLRR